MKKDEIFTVLITDYTDEGVGVGKIPADEIFKDNECKERESVGGFPLFISNTAIGDVVEAKVTKLNKTYGFAKVVRIKEFSKDRITPDCRVAKECGGCCFRHITYESELKWKENKVFQAVKRIGHIDYEFEKLPIKGMDNPYRYRNKAQYPLATVNEKNGKKRTVAGFYRSGTHSVIETDDCLIEKEINRTILSCICNYCDRNNISAYDEVSGRGMLRHVLIREGFNTGRIMVCLIVNGKKEDKAHKKHIEAIAGELLRIEGICSVMVNYNSAKTNVIMGKDTEVVFGEAYITDTIGELEYKISARSFFQVNPVQTYHLYSIAKEFAGLSKDDILWDLYCGTGTISLFMAKDVKKVFGVEIVPEAIADAKENAVTNGIDNAFFICGKAEDIDNYKHGGDTGEAADTKVSCCEAFGRQNPEVEIEDPDIIIVDPPRKGCDPKLLDTIVNSSAGRVVYISCNPSTLARDIAFLSDNGFVLEKVCPVDMFPRSGHVETVVLMSKVK